MKLERHHIAVFLGLAAFVWWLVLFAQGTPVGWDHSRPFSIVLSFLVLLGLAFEFLLWRQPWLHWFVKRPDLRGTWRVELQSDWTEEDILTIDCYMGVSQTLSSLHMHLMTSESESWFIAERILRSPSGTGYQLAGVYTNKPQMHLRGDRSEMHQGALILRTHGPENHPDTLTGEYWTDRKTTGHITCTERLPRIFSRFEDAADGFATRWGE